MSDPVLQQHEVDQLVQAIRDGRVPTPPQSLHRLRELKRIDFRDTRWSQDRIVRRRLPVLELVFDRLAPTVQITLTKSLRFPVRIEKAHVELQKFGDFRARFGARPTLFEVMRLDPLRGYSVIAMDSSILYSLVDALMGGLGIADATPEREISDIEIELLNRVHGDLLRDFENAWRPWFPLRAEHVRADRTTQVLSTLPDEEVCHVGKILVTGDVLPQSPIYFVLPYTCLEPLHEAISARAGEELDPNWRANLESNLRETEVALVGLLGEAEVPASVVRRLAPGDVIELDRQAHEPLSLLVEGQETFRGQLGKNHHKYAMRIASKKEIQHRIVDRTLGQVLIRKGLISREQLAVAQVDELLNRRPILDSIVGRGWAERRVLEHALAS